MYNARAFGFDRVADRLAACGRSDDDNSASRFGTGERFKLMSEELMDAAFVEHRTRAGSTVDRMSANCAGRPPACAWRVWASPARRSYWRIAR